MRHNMQKYIILKDVLDFAKNKFYEYTIENPSFDIAMLASKAFGLSKIQLITKEYVSFESLHISDEQIEEFLYFVELRCKKNSISAILGIKNFYGLDFIVTNAVLTPRPETEVLVESFTNYILEYINNYAFTSPHKIIKIIDIGTGSGCIAVSVAKILEKKLLQKNYSLEIIACDISEKALEVAQKNIDKHKVSHIVKLRQSDLLEEVVNKNKNFLENCFIITNLPYIPKNDAKEMSNEVLKGDPFLALFSGEKGTDLYEKLFRDLFQKNKNFYAINSCFFEFDSGIVSENNVDGKNYQKEFFTEYLKHLEESTVHFFSDYSGCKRFGKILFLSKV